MTTATAPVSRTVRQNVAHSWMVVIALVCVPAIGIAFIAAPTGWFLLLTVVSMGMVGGFHVASKPNM